MSFGNTFENDLLKLIFNNTAIALVGDASGLQPSATAGSLYVSLHTADPGEGGSQTTSEVSYTGYARVAVARSGSGWTVTANAVENAALIQFGTRTDAGSAEVLWVAVGTDASGAGKVIARMPLAGAPYNFTAKADDTITAPGHNFAVNDRVVFQQTPGDVGSLPTGITQGTVYYVKTVSGDDITISTTQGGATLDITAVGTGQVQKVSAVTVSQNIRPEIAAGALDFSIG